MQDGQSLKPNGVKLTNIHVLVSTAAAIAGVAIAAYQAFGPHSASQQPLNVVVAIDPQKADAAVPNSIVEKSDAGPAIATEAIDLAHEASLGAALNDGADKRYNFSKLFDGQDDTFVAINRPDQELNVLVTFRGNRSYPVTAIEYTPPAGVDPTRMVTTLDVMVLPEGQMGASGREVLSFSLPQSAESHTYAIPGNAHGKALWLRVAGNPAADKSYVGDFRVLSEGLAP
jgi:hypothetical protein